ncbi:hypothetical protein FRB95_004267 [Tulasnella sp. JGI-2019a]|nr:hypothetical protein FRB93_005636 [Tulasnella sp. JGI-2019a]KAG9030174.1 hypothetical protein FRB95_004267 [Tulasnella sp. JGI-2019a]
MSTRALGPPEVTVLDALRNCQHACSQALEALVKRLPVIITTPGGDGTGNPTLVTLRTDFISLLAMVYSHATRVGMSFKPPITDLAAVKSLQELSADVERLASCALAVHTSSGRILGKQFVWAAQEVAENVQSLAIGLLAASTAPSDDYLRRVGQIHAVVEKIKASLPVDQTAAVQQIWSSNSESIEDALNECKLLMDGGGDDDMFEDEEWDGMDLGDESQRKELNEDEMKTTQQVYTVIRLHLALHQKLIKHYSRRSINGDAAQETRLERSTDLVAAIDELVASLPPPHIESSIKSKVKDVLAFSQRTKADLEMEALTEKVAGSTMSIQDGETGPDASRQENRRKILTGELWFKTVFIQIENASKPFLT